MEKKVVEGLEKKAVEDMGTPTEYFDYVKSRQKVATGEFLEKVYNNSLELLTKYEKTGQVDGMKKLIFMLDRTEKELEIINRGYNIYVNKSDIQEYIDLVDNKVVKIIELSRYEREVPDEIVDDMLEVKDLFDDFFVVFTDYTGEAERKVEKERRDKDPILFGVFYNEESNELLERMYFIGDWEDEYCDLTLDKMVAEMSKHGNENVKKDLLTDEDVAELKTILFDKPKNVSTGKIGIMDKIKNFFS